MVPWPQAARCARHSCNCVNNIPTFIDKVFSKGHHSTPDGELILFAMGGSVVWVLAVYFVIVAVGLGVGFIVVP